MSANASSERPDPDALLARLHEDDARARRGRLKIFFGAAPGVGKTYAMLEAARALKAAGTDVVVGYVEPHGRSETEALLDGLEVLPPQELEHRGIGTGHQPLIQILTRHHVAKHYRIKLPTDDRHHFQPRPARWRRPPRW